MIFDYRRITYFMPASNPCAADGVNIAGSVAGRNWNEFDPILAFATNTGGLAITLDPTLSRSLTGISTPDSLYGQGGNTSDVPYKSHIPGIKIPANINIGKPTDSFVVFSPDMLSSNQPVFYTDPESNTQIQIPGLRDTLSDLSDAEFNNLINDINDLRERTRILCSLLNLPLETIGMIYQMIKLVSITTDTVIRKLDTALNYLNTASGIASASIEELSNAANITKFNLNTAKRYIKSAFNNIDRIKPGAISTPKISFNPSTILRDIESIIRGPGFDSCNDTIAAIDKLIETYYAVTAVAREAEYIQVRVEAEINSILNAKHDIEETLAELNRLYKALELYISNADKIASAKIRTVLAPPTRLAQEINL